MKIFTLTILLGLLGLAICKPLDTKEATDALVEIEKQRLIKFPEELELPIAEGKEKHDEAKRILQEIEKINQSLGYIKKQSDQAKSPAILDSSQYLFPNAGYQPFHVQSSQILGANGETLLLPSIRSVKLEPSYYNKAGEYNAAPARKSQKEIITKETHNSLYFKPQTVEWASPQLRTGEKFLPTHFVIPVRLYKQNKQEYLEKHTPQEYRIKGYKIVGDIDHFYGKTKTDKTSSTASRVKSTPKFQLFVLPEETLAKTPFKDIKSNDENSMENSSREEKLANRPYKVQSNTQAVTNGNTVNATSTSQIIKKKLVPKKGATSNPVISASSSTVVKVQPATNGNGHQQQQHTQQQQHQQQQHQQHQQQQQQHFQKPLPAQQITQIVQPPEATPSYTVINNQPGKLNSQIIKNPSRPILNQQNNNNINNNNNNNNAIKNRPLLELQNNINSINNATSNAIKTAFQNIFKFPFGQQGTVKPSTATEFTPVEVVPLPVPEPHQQQFFYTPSNAFNAGQAQAQAQTQPFYTEESFQNDHLDNDYKWEDENSAMDSSSSDYQDNLSNSNESTVPEEKKLFSNILKHKAEVQQQALKQGGIIIQKLKVRKGGIAIAGPGGVATAGSGGTAIVGPGGYALTHPRSLTIAGPGAKIIAIPSAIDLKDALQRTNLELQTFPREGRIVATGPTVYYSPPTGDYVEI